MTAAAGLGPRFAEEDGVGAPSGKAAQIRAVLFDMDGVIRHWDDVGAYAGEQAAGLPPGSIAEVAYDVPEFVMTQVGTATAREWVDAVARELVARHGPHAAVAVEEFYDYAGRIDREMVELVAQVRDHVPVALLSNATDQLREHLVHHDLVESFDVVFCSAEIGVAKPDRGIFEHAARVLGVAPGECFFTDDRPANVAGARDAGMEAEVFTSRADLIAHLATRGLVLDRDPSPRYS